MYTITVDGQSHVVQVNEGGDVSNVVPVAATAAAPVGDGEVVPAPLAGNIWKIEVAPGQEVVEGEVLIILEAMKMETQICAPKGGTITAISVNTGDMVKVGDPLVFLA